MAGFWDGIRGLVNDVGDFFESGYEAADEFLGDFLPDLGGDGEESLSSRVFGSLRDSGGGAAISGRSARTTTSLTEGLITTSPGRARRTGETTPVASVDPRAIEAAWVARLDNIAKITSRTK